MGALWGSFVNFMMSGLNLLATATGSYGLAIIAFTVLIRLLLYPLTIAQLRNARAQQLLQPQMQALRQKYADDKVVLQQKMMELYKENNANPVAGCLPTIIQFPILIGLYQAMYNMLRNPENLKANVSFLWVHNLALPDLPRTLDPVAGHDIFNGLFILPILAAALQWVQQRMMMSPTANQDPQQRMMNQMMQFMPLMVVFFGFRFPAGLALYWVTNTLVAIFQQYFVSGWGSLAHVIPALDRGRAAGAGFPGRVVAPPEVPATTQTAATDRVRPAGRGPTSPERGGRRTAAAEEDGRPQAGRAGNDSQPGAMRANGDKRRNGPDGGRSRPAPRRQGSKR